MTSGKRGLEGGRGVLTMEERELAIMGEIYRWIVSLCLVAVGILVQAPGVAQELTPACTVSVLNRSAPVDEEGVWVLPNVPTNMGQVRVRATCTEEGVTHHGESDFFTVPVDGVIKIEEIRFEGDPSIPTSIEMSAEDPRLTRPGETRQLVVMAEYPDGSIADVSSQSAGTTYTTTNPAIVTVSSEGLVTAQASGVALVTAIHEGSLGVTRFEVVLGQDSDGDGLPDDWEIANGLDPNNPADALEDADFDGLGTTAEFTAGTDPANPDTDGDGLLDGEEVNQYGTIPLLFDSDGDQVSDGLEVFVGSNPLDPASVSLAGILEGIEVFPSSFELVFETAIGESSRRVDVTGYLIDGSSIEIRRALYGTTYTSSDLAVASFGAEAGRIFAGQDGTATITIENNGFTATSQVTVSTFSPVALSFIRLSGLPNGVAVADSYALVASGGAGLHVVDAFDPEQPRLVASVDTSGNANDVRVSGFHVYVADGSAGLVVINVADPTNPWITGLVDTAGVATDLVVEGDMVYVADGTAGVVAVDVTDPTAPAIVGSVDTPGNARGIDAVGDLVIVADAQGGLHVIDTSEPGAMSILGSTHLRAGYSRAADVVVRGSMAYVADGAWSLGGLRIVDFSEPTTPVVVGTTTDGFGLVGVALDGSLVLGADYFFVNAVPIFDVGLLPPSFNAVLDFSRAPSFRDDNGNGITTEHGLVYLTGEQWLGDNRTWGNGGLHIGRFRIVDDTFGIAPEIEVVEPAAGFQIRERRPFTARAEANDDVRVERVRFLLDGAVMSEDFRRPFEATIVAARPGNSVLTAEAVDLGGNIGTAEAIAIVIQPDADPIVELLSPTQMTSLVEGSVADIAAAASDDSAIVSVDIVVDGVLAGEFSEPPYRIEWPIPVGSASFTVEALATDDFGQVGSTGPVVFPVQDDLPPSVEIIDPVDGSTLIEGSTLPVDIGALDDVGVESVEVVVDGVPGPRTTSEPYQVEISVPFGVTEMVLSAVAVDALGQQGASAPVTLTVIPDPGTTVVGVVELDSVLVAGADVLCSGFATISESDGSFTVDGLPATNAFVSCSARYVDAAGISFVGRSASVRPVPDGMTDVGPIALEEFNAGIGMVTDWGDGSVLVFDGESGENLGVVPIPSSRAFDCSVTADGSLGFVADFDFQLWIIDLSATPPALASGTNPIPIANHGEDTSITPDERYVVVCDGSAVEPVSVVDIASRSEVSTFSLGSDCNSVDVCSDGSVLVTSFNDDVVRRLFIDGEGTITDTGESLSAIDPNNVICAPGGRSGLVITRSSDQVTSFTIPGLGPVDTRALGGTFGISGVVHPDGSLVYTRDNGGGVEVLEFDPIAGTLGASPLWSFPISDARTLFGVDQMALEPNGATLYVSQPGALNAYDAVTGGLLQVIGSDSLDEASGVCFARPQ